MNMSEYSNFKLKKKKSPHMDLVPIRKKDIEKIRIWRNQQREVLRQNNFLTKKEQENYFDKTIKPSFKEKTPKMILFSIIQKEKCIGYGGLVHIDWKAKRGEISFLSETKRSNTILKKDFENFLEMILEVGFQDLKLNKITTETFAFREDIIKILENRGFEKEGILKDQVLKKGKYYNSFLHHILSKKFMKKVINEEKNILVTSVSNKTTLLEQLKRSVISFKFNIKIFGGDTNNNCIGKFFVDGFWKMPSIENLKITEIITYCKKNKINFIIPTRDGDLVYFAKNKSILLKNNIFTMISPLKTVECCIDKISFFEKGKEAGIPIIQTSKNIQEINAKRYVVKERFGSGSKQIGLNLSKKYAINYAMFLENPIFQPFIQGNEFSIDAYITKNKKIQGIVIRKRNLVVNGESKITQTVKNKKLENICRKIIEKFNFYGHIMFQVIIDSKNKIQLVECNCRFGGASSLSIECGLDSFNWFIKEGINQKIENKVIKIPKKTLIRYSKDMMIN